MKFARPLMTELRSQGFKRLWNDRGSKHTEAVTCYVKLVTDRRVEVQLWGAGGPHRASHFLNGRMSTTPTDFQSVDEMKAAIDHELTRVDHPPMRSA